MSAYNDNIKNLVEYIEKIVDVTTNVKHLVKTSHFPTKILLESSKSLKQCVEIVSKVQSNLREEVKENTNQVIP
jgi:hypothetical protein